MSCPIDVLHSGEILSPFSLFTLLTALTSNITLSHSLTFRHDQYEFSIDFIASKSVFTKEELDQSGETPMSFCHFQGTNYDGFRAWLSICSEDQIDMILRTSIESYAMENNGTHFVLVAPDIPNCSFYDSLNIEIRLVYSEIWKDPTKGGIDYRNKGTTLDTFSIYKDKVLKTRYFDNANLYM
ncbi:hypothetical protein PFISCL1PPCAC_1673, partial [Pristionchus fissidentatus]